MILDWDTLRFVNIALGAAALFLTVDRRCWWRAQSFPVRLLTYALAVSIGVAVYGAIEILMIPSRPAPGGLRVIGVTVFLAYTLVALVLIPRRKDCHVADRSS